MKSNVEELGAHPKMTVKEAMGLAHRECEDYSDVMILAYDKDTGDLIVRTSSVSRADANWMLDKAKQHALASDV